MCFEVFLYLFLLNFDVRKNKPNDYLSLGLLNYFKIDLSYHKLKGKKSAAITYY